MATMAINGVSNMAKYINETRKKYGTILECYWDDEIDSVLIPDNFLDEERIQEVLNACTVEAWEHVYANRHNYSQRIRQYIEPKDFRVDTSKYTKMVVREMTEEDMVRLEKEKSAAKRIQFMEDVWPEMKKDVPERPHQDIDDEADELWEDLVAAKQRMTEFLGKKTKKYVPPSARKTVDPDQQDIEDDIAACQKAFDDCEKRIDEADEKYWQEKANVYFEAWMCEV